MRWLGVSVVAVACAAAEPEGGEVMADDGLYRVIFAVTPDPPGVEPLRFDLGLEDAAGAAVSGAGIGATPWMPDMGHGIDDEPVVAEAGEGAYTVDLTPTMPGAWELRLEIDAAPGSDAAVIPFDVE